MSVVDELHDEAMSFVDRAIALRNSNVTAAAEIFAEAYELEIASLNEHIRQSNAEPTRGLLARSAAAIAIDAEDFDGAVRAIGIGLAGQPPTSLRDELLNTLEQATFRRHLRLEDVSLTQRELLLSLSGEGVGFGMIEDGEILPRISRVTSMIQRTAQRLTQRSFQERLQVRRDSDFRTYVSTPMAASFAVSIRIGRHAGQKRFDVDQNQVAQEFLECIQIFATQGIQGLSERISEPAYLRNFVAQLRQISPDGRRVQQIAFQHGMNDSNAAFLRSMPSEAWSLGPSITEDIERVKISGLLHGADTSSKRGRRSSISIEDSDGNRTPIRVPKGMMNDIVRPYWDKRVDVVAVKQKRSLVLEDISERRAD